MKRVCILGACRTPIGKMGGALASVPAAELAALVIREAVRRSGAAPEAVDHVYLGCVLQAGLGQNVARQAALKAGLPVTATAQTVNTVCGSGLDAVQSAARMIQTGEADIVVAGGVESMSGAPFAVMNARYGYKMGSPMLDTPLVDLMVKDGLWEAMHGYHMGITAENVAERWGITRAEAARFAADSQKKAAAAIAGGKFREELVPVTVSGRGGGALVDADEGPRPGTTVEALARLKPAFKPDGVVTAGNSSGINDGAAAVVVASLEKAEALGLRQETEWLGGTLAGVDPAIMGIGPVESTRKLLCRLGMTLEEIDLVEGNEAFAVQSIAVQRELGIPDEKLNVNGGAIALGHPIGASGCRILVTLIHAMRQRQARTGLATLCVGGGMGCSAVIRRM